MTSELKAKIHVADMLLRMVKNAAALERLIDSVSNHVFR